MSGCGGRGLLALSPQFFRLPLSGFSGFSMQRKHNLASAFGIQKILGVTMHFSGKIKLQFGKKSHTCFFFILLLFFFF